MQTDCGILIIGGGPAGLSTALHLVRGFPDLTSRIVILEKARYPRTKLCAGGLVLDAEVILEQLGLNVGELPHVDVESIRFDFRAKGLKIRVPKRHALRVIRRDEFDHWLAKNAASRGVEIREGVNVKNIAPSSNCVQVETDQGTFCAQIVVGADGSNGVTRRCIFPRAPVHTARVLEVITPPCPSTSTSPKFSPNKERRNEVAFFDFFPVPQNIAGYVWDFPTQVKGEAMRCWGIYDTNLLANEQRPQLKEALTKEMKRIGLNLADYEIQGHPIRWFSPNNQMSVPRVLLVGDAAGADPLFGEGISIALGYGVMAAREISEALQRNDFSFSNYQNRILRSALGQTLLVRWCIARVIYALKWKWFQILLWRIMKPIVMFVGWALVLNWAKRLR